MLAVDGTLVVQTAGLSVRVDAHDSVVTCRLDGGTGGRGPDIIAALRRSNDALVLMRTLVPLLVRAGIRVDVAAGDRRIASAGTGVEADGVARLLRIPAARLG